MFKFYNSRFALRSPSIIALLFGFLSMLPFSGYCALQLNIFPPEEVIDFDEPGVNGFDVDYRLFGSQVGAGAASASINYYYCDNASGSGTCYLIETRQILLNCNSNPTICFPQGGLQTHFISRTSLPTGFTDVCFPGDWYIIGQVVGNTGSSLNTNPTSPVVFASSRPELEPTNVSVAPNPALPGQMLISCTIQNNGPCPAPASQATVWLTPDAGTPILFNVPLLNAGVSVTVTVGITDLDVGVPYDATLTVDIFNSIAERDETNNVFTISEVFEIPQPMEIQSLSSNSDLVASSLTITGSPGFTAQGDFFDVQAVFLGGVELPIQAVGENTLDVLIPYFVSTDFITLQTIYGTTVVSPNEFTVLCSPDEADIEGSTLPFPWAIDNPDNDQTFQVYNGGGAGGSTKSIIMNHWIYPTIGALDFIILPHVCVDSSPEWYLQFDVAYTYYDDGNSSFVDNLIIADFLTGDIIEFINGTDLATAPPQAAIFEPNAADWFTREIPLANLINNGQRELYLALVTQNGNGNAMYLDNIRVTNSSILPVEYASLEANPIGQAIEVKWSTSSEVNNDYFIVQASPDGRVFEDIGIVPGAGSTEVIKKYSYIDRNPNVGVNYYRLLQVDFDGTEELSSIVSARFESDNDKVTISPNPGKGIIQINTNSSDNLSITINDYTGRMIEEWKYQDGASLDLSHLPDGMYVLYITGGAAPYTARYFKRAE